MRQPVTELQPGRQRAPADAPTLPVLGPRAPGEVAPHDAFDREHLERAHEHRPPGHGIRDRAGLAHEVVRDAVELIEPPQAEPREQLALAGDARLEHVVERTHAVARDHEHLARPRGRPVEVAHLARVGELPAGEIHCHALIIQEVVVRECGD